MLFDRCSFIDMYFEGCNGQFFGIGSAIGLALNNRQAIICTKYDTVTDTYTCHQ